MKQTLSGISSVEANVEITQCSIDMGENKRPSFEVAKKTVSLKSQRTNKYVVSLLGSYFSSGFLSK